MPLHRYLLCDKLNIYKEKELKTLGIKSQGIIPYYVQLRKNSLCFDEEIEVKLLINTNKIKLKIQSIEFLINRKIKLFDKILSGKENEKVLGSAKIGKEKIKKTILDFYEKIKIDKFDMEHLDEKQKERFKKFDEDFCNRDEQRAHLCPSMDGIKFKCIYEFKIIIRFENILKSSITEAFTIDLYNFKP